MMEAKVEENLEKLKVEDSVNEETEEDVVDPWNVTSASDKGIDYDKLIRKFYSLHFRSQKTCSCPLLRYFGMILRYFGMKIYYDF